MPTASDPLLHRDKLRAGAAAVALQLALGYAILTGLGLGVELARRPERPLSIFTLPPPAAPREEPPPPPEPADRPREEEGRAAPPNLRATPKPIVAPVPIVQPPPPPVLAAPVASTGDAPAAGAAEVRGPGTGAGGIGDGLGSGGRGDGTGGGGTGTGTPSRHIAGRIRDRDYPDAARRTGAQGSVIVDIHIDARGRVARCGVYRSSGSPELDEGTCRLIAKRFRYEPARNALGQPIADHRRWKQDWWRDLSYTAQAR
ncbi:energy transducer TonB [Sphingomonas lenta]|uniref:Energy transducer TonB n=1 Tax=Sphingomonas lenta TaxID=1141887 RepID=A0A2A2SH53_9SPHN|nr:energy transducer TonB [Sphingomonas lenta]PAX08548.1 energy transducer TonB [Sphingomonas lenta]